MAGQGTPAVVLLIRQGVPHALHRYDVSVDTPNYGAAVAEALATPPGRVFKTLIAEIDGALAAAVVPVTGELDLKALATALHGKRAALADRGLAEKTTGYVRGGISPLGQRKRLPTAVDSSAGEWDTIFVSAGRRGLQLELAPDDLIRLTDAVLAPLSAGSGRS